MRFQVGDKICRQGPLGFYHYGIYVGHRWPYGHAVVHNSKNEGVQLIHLSTFADGQPITIKDRLTDWRAQEMVAQRALSLLGKQYDLTLFNCEHAANYAQKGIPASPQLQGTVLIIGLMDFALLLASR
jgi:Lecithin retinol acyltransferase